VRGKTIGIVGYGHVGSQVSVLSESMGMRVIFYDVVPKMPLGSSSSCQSLEELLGKADFVTLHVPELPSTVVRAWRDGGGGSMGSGDASRARVCVRVYTEHDRQRTNRNDEEGIVPTQL
jgi:hypothetical protein